MPSISVSATSGASVSTSVRCHVGQVVAEALEEVADLAEHDALVHPQQVDAPNTITSDRDGGRHGRHRERAHEHQELAHEPGQAGQAEAGQHEEPEQRRIHRGARARARPSWRWSGRGSARR